MRRPTITTVTPDVALSTAGANEAEQGVDLANRGGGTESVLIKPSPIRNPVSGPMGAVSGNVAIFDTNTGRLIGDSGVAISTLISAVEAQQGTAALLVQLLIEQRITNQLLARGLNLDYERHDEWRKDPDFSRGEAWNNS